MINDQKDNLFQLIKSLTKSEKRQFKLYVGRMGSNNNAKFLSVESDTKITIISYLGIMSNIS